MRLVKLRHAALLALSLGLGGCASLFEPYVSAADTWNGATYEEVVTRWGTPVRSTSFNDGRMVYTWVSEGTISAGGVWPSVGISGGRRGGIGVGVGVGMGAGRLLQVSCERTLIFANGRVNEQTWQGPPEFCDAFRKS